jgi:hypothetical protein
MVIVLASSGIFSSSAAASFGNSVEEKKVIAKQFQRV